MVLVFTDNANDSAEIKKELALASQHRLIVIPARVEDVVPSEALAYELATRQWIDLFEDWERAIERLVASVSTVLAVEPASAARGAAAIPKPGGPASSPLAYPVLSLNAHLLAAFLLNLGAFLLILMIVFMQRDNFAGAFAAVVGALAIGFVGQRTLDKDESVRMAGLAIGVVGVIAVGAINLSPQFFRVGLLESRSIQNGSLMMAILFVCAVQFYGVEWKKLKNGTWVANKLTEKFMRFLTSRLGAGVVFASTLLFVSATWELMYGLAGNSIAAVLVLIGVHIALAVFCYVRFRSDIAAQAAEIAPVAVR
jgi:hypothetical protein